MPAEHASIVIALLQRLGTVSAGQAGPVGGGGVRAAQLLQRVHQARALLRPRMPRAAVANDTCVPTEPGCLPCVAA